VNTTAANMAAKIIILIFIGLLWLGVSGDCSENDGLVKK